jgi:hypothetical protein
MKKNLFTYIVIFWFIAVIIFAILFVSCVDSPKIEQGDRVENCIIDTFYRLPQISVMDIEPKYRYTTDCGFKFTTTRNDVYKIGDTIKIVYKKK